MLPQGYESDQVLQLETNLDDISPEVPALLVNLGEWRQEASRGDAAQKIVEKFGLVEWASGHGEFGPLTVYQLAK
jgi:hypothetical protein